MVLACAAPASAAFPAWTTYDHDGARSAFDPDSSSPLPPKQLWQTNPSLDGQIYGQPLVFGTRVYVATENDSVYALNAATGAVVWHKQFGTPVPDHATSGCGNIGTVGTTGTPVIDPATKRIYAVADTWDGSNPNSARHMLVGYNLANGSSVGTPRVVDAPGSLPRYQLQRPALGLDAGKIIVGYGGYAGDCGPYNGWVVSTPENGGPVRGFRIGLAGERGAVWGAGNGPAIDAAGHVYESSGNGDPSTYAYQESVVTLNWSMRLLDHWAPSDWSSLDSGDTDLGSSAPLLLPGGLVFQIGKEGLGYLLRASHLGGTGAAPAFQAQVCSGAYGGAIYFGGVIYVACLNGLQALSLNTSAPSFAPLSGFQADSAAIGPPIIAGGLVWSVGWGSGTLFGLNPRTGATRFSANVGNVNHFVAPSAAGGRLFVSNGDQVVAFTIARTPLPSRTVTALRSSANPSRPGTRVTFTATVRPVPDAGRVSFTDNGATIRGCRSLPISATGQGRCTVFYVRRRTHAIVAVYSGDRYYAASRATLRQRVTGPPPVVSHPHLSVSGKTATLKLTLSRRAQVVVAICARHGSPCTAGNARKLLRFAGAPGGNTFRFGVRTLGPGRYVAAITAHDGVGNSSKRRTLQFVIS